VTDRQADVDRLGGLVLRDLRSTDEGAKTAFHREFGDQLSAFAGATTIALDRWQQFMEPIAEDASRELMVAAIVFTALNHNIMSFKLFMAGYTVASGALFRQVLEGTSLALVCSAKSLTVLDRFIEAKYSPSKAVGDLAKHADEVNIPRSGLQTVLNAYEFYHRYAHLSRLTIAAGLNFSVGGAPNVGAYFDPDKLSEYRKEIRGRVSFANALPNVVSAVAKNVSGWRKVD